MSNDIDPTILHRVIVTAKAEITADYDAGVLGDTECFEDLNEYVDANEYGLAALEALDMDWLTKVAHLHASRPALDEWLWNERPVD